MPKKIVIRGNLRSSDFNRALITDTSPFEVPIIFSNDGFYKNLSRLSTYGTHFQAFVERLLKTEKYTIPYRYNIVKDSRSVRQLSLLHPSAQINTCEFYREYAEVICYYSSISEYTIRAPQRIGSTFHFRSPIVNKNKYKNSSVDTVEIDKLIRNPASYFAYKGYDRLYKFFNSIEFINLEKKYRYMLSLDIAKCFASIYTHSIAWAVKDIHTAKENIFANHFGSHFDSLMQRMNYNETNGICIGSETSRIFAEIILGKIDANIQAKSVSSGLHRKSEYDLKRYVDNYYIFANSESEIDIIKSNVASCLLEFKLHINEHKSELHRRPFYTKKSKVIDDVSFVISANFKKFIEYDYQDGRKYSYPIRINRYESLYKSIIQDLKSACYSSNSSYEDMANYVISSFTVRLTALIDDSDLGVLREDYIEDDYINAIIMLLELSFFFYMMSPTVASSLSISKSIILAAKLFKATYPQRLPFLQERIVRWTGQLIRDPRLRTITQNSDAIPIEILNILIAMHDIAADHSFSEKIFRDIFRDIDGLKYFSLVSCLFIIRDNSKFDRLRSEIYGCIRKRISSSRGLAISSHDVHLLMDIISCPYLLLADRVELYKDATTALKIGKVTNAEAEKSVQDCEKSPWFVSWNGIELLNLIVKKELSAVY